MNALENCCEARPGFGASVRGRWRGKKGACFAVRFKGCNNEIVTMSPRRKLNLRG